MKKIGLMKQLQHLKCRYWVLAGHIEQERTLGEKMSQYVVICRKNGFDVRIKELVLKRKKSFVTEGRKNNWSIFVFVFWLFSKSWLDGCRWVSLDRLASPQPPIPPTRENDDAKKIQGEYNLGDIFISARFCANFFLDQLKDTRRIQPGQYLDINQILC